MEEIDVILYAGILLSIAFSYIPRLAPKFDALDPTYKRLIMLACIFLVSLGLYGLSCAKVIDVGITCDLPGAWEVLKIFVLATIANQSAYLISPKPEYTRAK